MNPLFKRQRGAALIVALVMLVIVTMLGLTTMNTSVMEERMAGNSRSQEIAFDAAEAAMREGETAIVEGRFYSTDPKDGTAVNGLNVPVIGTDPSPWGTGAGTADVWYEGDWREPAGANLAEGWIAREEDSGLAIEAPQFITEYMVFFTRDLNCGADIQSAQTQDCYRYAYRVTGRGWGMNTNALAVVQSIFADRK